MLILIIGTDNGLMLKKAMEVGQSGEIVVFPECRSGMPLPKFEHKSVASALYALFRRKEGDLIVTTHSDGVIQGLLEKVQQGKLLADKLRFWFVSAKDSYVIPVSAQGELLGCPETG